MQRLVAPVGHVVEVDDDASHRGLVEQVDQARLHPAPGAVVVLDAHLRVELPAGCSITSMQGVTGEVEVVGVDHVHVVRAEERLGRSAEDALDRGADVDERTIVVEHDDDVGRVLNEGAHAALAAHDRLARLLLLLAGPSEHLHDERQAEGAQRGQPVHPGSGE